MDNKIIIDTNDNNKQKKVKKPLTDSQKESNRVAMKKYYLKMKSDPEYIERQRLSSKTHYYKHKEEVLERMKKYQKNKQYSVHAQIFNMLDKLQKDNIINISEESLKKIEDKLINNLAQLHLSS